MKRDAVRTFGIVLIAANVLIAFLSVANLVLIAAGAIQVDVPGEDDISYDYDAANQTLVIDTQFSVRNDGIYPVTDLDIESTLRTDTGVLLIDFAKVGLEVDAGEKRTFPIQVVMDLRELASPELLRLLVEDGELELKVKIRADYTLGLTKFRSDETVTYEWKSPVSLLRELLLEGNLSKAAEEVLGWAGPIVREWLAEAVLDAAMADGEWRTRTMGDWANMSYRLWLDETNGTGAFDVVLAGNVAGFEWSVNGTVPLMLVDGEFYLEREVASDAA